MVLVVQWITNLTLRFLTHRSDHFSDQQKKKNISIYLAFHLLLKAKYYFDTTANTTRLTKSLNMIKDKWTASKNKNKYKITSIDKNRMLQIKQGR